VIGESSDASALTPVERAVLTYTDVLTATPWLIALEHVTALRSVGFDDRGLHDICAIVSYFAFVNRIADGLGVELEG
jgi:alkylhydroperoxidase family enzyme